MQTTLIYKSFLPALILVGVLSVSTAAIAEDADVDRSQASDRIVIRQTIPDPDAVKRSPLTSDRLSTTSTRYIDARRGFRPYSSVFGDRVSHHDYAAYDDHFGISRPEYRPWSYSQRAPRSFVSQFRNEDADQSQRDASDASKVIVIVNERLREDKPEPKVDMTIRVHSDTNAIPTTTGAVLITADGTVIQVGD